MAAIICKPITSFLNFLCTAPCKICTGGCTNPLAAFCGVTFVTQIPLAAMASLGVGGLFQGCKGSQWLVGMLAASISHVVASVYLARRVTNRTDEVLRDRHTAWNRISYLLCNDPFIAFYLLVVLFFIVWLVMGSAWSIGGTMRNGGCGTDVGDRVGIVLGLGWFYLIAGPSVLMCNMCCVRCDKKDYAGTDEEFAAKQAQKEAKRKKRASSATSGSNDIENPPQPHSHVPQPPSQTKPTAPPLKTYTLEGVEIPDNRIDHVVEAEVVIEGGDLPPPVPPPNQQQKPEGKASVY